MDRAAETAPTTTNHYNHKRPLTAKRLSRGFLSAGDLGFVLVCVGNRQVCSWDHIEDFAVWTSFRCHLTVDSSYSSSSSGSSSSSSSSSDPGYGRGVPFWAFYFIG